MSHSTRIAKLVADGTTLFSGDEAGRVVAWDLAVAEPRTWLEAGAPIVALARADDGRLAVVSGHPGVSALRVTTLDHDGRPLEMFESRLLEHAVFGPEGCLACGGAESVACWTGGARPKLRDAPSRVVKLLRVGERVVGLGTEGVFDLDREAGAHAWLAPATPSGRVVDLDASASGELFALACLVFPSAPRAVATSDDLGDEAFADDERASGAGPPAVVVEGWTRNALAWVVRLEAWSRPLVRLTWDGRHLLINDAASAVTVLDPRTGRRLARVDAGDTIGALAVGGGELFVGREDGRILRLDLEELLAGRAPSPRWLGSPGELGSAGPPAPARKTVKKRPTVKGPTTLEHVEALGWFAALPPAAAAAYRAQVAERMSGAPFDALAVVLDDAESIFEEGSYIEQLQPFIDGSFGLFRPTDLRESWSAEVVRFGFTLDGQRFDIEAPGGEWVVEEFLQLLTRALPAVGRPYGFHCVDTDSQCYAFVLTSQDAFDAAVRARIVAPGLEFAYDEDGSL